METSFIPVITRIAGKVARYGSSTLPFGLITAIYLKDRIISYLYRYLYLSFCVVLLLEVIRGVRGLCRHLEEDFFIASWVAVFFVILPFTLLLVRPFLLRPERALFFALPFMLIGVAHAGSDIRRRKVGNIIMVLVILFTTLNLFNSSVVPANPLDASERERIITVGDEKLVSTGYHMPQDPQGIAAMNFYQNTEDAKFVRWFIVENKKVFAEAREGNGSKLYEVKPYTRTYVIMSPDSYLDSDRIYDDGEVKVYK